MDKYLFKVKIRDITRLSTGAFPSIFILALSKYTQRVVSQVELVDCVVFILKVGQNQNVLHPISKYL